MDIRPERDDQGERQSDSDMALLDLIALRDELQRAKAGARKWVMSSGNEQYRATIARAEVLKHIKVYGARGPAVGVRYSVSGDKAEYTLEFAAGANWADAAGDADAYVESAAKRHERAQERFWLLQTRLRKVEREVERRLGMALPAPAPIAQPRLSDQTGAEDSVSTALGERLPYDDVRPLEGHESFYGGNAVWYRIGRWIINASQSQDCQETRLSDRDLAECVSAKMSVLKEAENLEHADRLVKSFLSSPGVNVLTFGKKQFQRVRTAHLAGKLGPRG